MTATTQLLQDASLLDIAVGGRALGGRGMVDWGLAMDVEGREKACAELRREPDGCKNIV